jgi:hypothetical protein
MGEIGDRNFYVLIDESWDILVKEQMFCPFCLLEKKTIKAKTSISGLTVF